MALPETGPNVSPRYASLSVDISLRRRNPCKGASEAEAPYNTLHDRDYPCNWDCVLVYLDWRGEMRIARATEEKKYAAGQQAAEVDTVAAMAAT